MHCKTIRVVVRVSIKDYTKKKRKKMGSKWWLGSAACAKKRSKSSKLFPSNKPDKGNIVNHWAIYYVVILTRCLNFCQTLQELSTRQRRAVPVTVGQFRAQADATGRTIESLYRHMEYEWKGSYTYNI